MTTPHPGSRIDATQRAAAAAEPGTSREMHEQGPDMMAVPVTVQGQAPAINGRYSVITISASTASVVSVRQLLPYDDCRQVAHIIPIDGAIIVSTSKEQAQDPANVGGTYPSAGFPVPPIRHREAVWACNPSTSAAVRVSVAVETGAGT
jgi:hypothetical protein